MKQNTQPKKKEDTSIYEVRFKWWICQGCYLKTAKVRTLLLLNQFAGNHINFLRTSHFNIFLINKMCINFKWLTRKMYAYLFLIFRLLLRLNTKLPLWVVKPSAQLLLWREGKYDFSLGWRSSLQLTWGRIPYLIKK